MPTRTELLQARIDELVATLEIVATGIRRNKELNVCWLTGDAGAVHAVEVALRRKKIKKIPKRKK